VKYRLRPNADGGVRPAPGSEDEVIGEPANIRAQGDYDAVVRARQPPPSVSRLPSWAIEENAPVHLGYATGASNYARQYGTERSVPAGAVGLP
jgi:hypothetical protein